MRAPCSKVQLSSAKAFSARPRTGPLRVRLLRPRQNHSRLRPAVCRRRAPPDVHLPVCAAFPRQHSLPSVDSIRQLDRALSAHTLRAHSRCAWLRRSVALCRSCVRDRWRAKISMHPAAIQQRPPVPSPVAHRSVCRILPSRTQSWQQAAAQRPQRGANARCEGR